MMQRGHLALGHVGECMAARYLENRGFSIRDRNYRKPWGEIDLVAYKDNVLHFVEVKTGKWFPHTNSDHYRPEDHFDHRKRIRLLRVIKTYLLAYPPKESELWTLDLLVVRIDTTSKKVHISFLADV